MVDDLLGKNPFLELTEGQDAESQAEEGERGERGSALSPSQQAPLADVEGEGGTAALADDREFWQAGAVSNLHRAGESDLRALDFTPCRVGLREHLRSQINVMRLPERDRILSCIVAESVDDDGYLRQPLDELASLSGLVPEATCAEMSIALKRVQALDPLGVAARDVAECLRLQLPTIPCERTRAMARVVVDEHLDLLAAHDTAGLARALLVGAAEAGTVAQCLRRLDPRPGWRFETGHAAYIVPDVLASKIRGKWQVKLNPAVVPKVRMNQVYEELFKRHRDGGHVEMAEHLQEARWTLRNIEQRFSTILDIAAAIVQRQRHFLEFGPMAMKPLALKEIADEVGVHESTVSRVTNNKYMATPSGVYEMKRFFSRTIRSSNGSACCGTAIRGLLTEIIEAEPEGAPLSDAEITRLLARQGLVVARRTVTKYRQMLKIAPATRRCRDAVSG